MTTIEQVSTLIASGQRVVFQRVARTVDARQVAAVIGAEVSDDPFASASGARVVDARPLRDADFASWDVRRGDLERAAGTSPLVLLLDSVSGQALLRAAPQTASWAGGVWLPPDPVARPAVTDEEFALGERALTAALDEDPEFASAHRGQLVAVDLLTRRLFAATPDASAVEHAREYLDDGILFVGRVP